MNSRPANLPIGILYRKFRGQIFSGILWAFDFVSKNNLMASMCFFLKALDFC